jgi:hypothetical protein
VKCKTCNNELIGKYTLKFCSKSCAAIFNNKHKEPQSQETKLKKSLTLKKYYENRPGTQKGKISKYKINKKEKTCNYCGKNFTAVRNNNKFRTWPVLCSNECYINTKRKNARGNKNITYKEFNFDSNWEKDLAMFLDMKSIEWIQPKEPIKWIDCDNKTRKYFPDFYLPKFNLYLDPKNPICCYQQQEKLKVVSKQITLIYGDINYIKKEVAGLEGFEPSTL